MKLVNIGCIDCTSERLIDAHKKSVTKYKQEHPRCKSCAGKFHENSGHFEKGFTPWIKGRSLRLSPGTEFKKGNIPWNNNLKGVHFSPSTEFKVGQMENENHPHWKGDMVGYAGIHKWVHRKLGKANNCVHCGKTDGKIEWANKSHEYKRELSDWLQLCKKCHIAYDRNGFWGAASRKYNLQ